MAVTPPGSRGAEHTQGPGMAVLNAFQAMVCAVGYVMPHPTSEYLPRAQDVSPGAGQSVEAELL